MYPAERQAAILASARRDPEGKVSVSSLSAHLGVAPETVRRDLAALERQGMVRRRHGGAVLTPHRRPFEPSLGSRRGKETAERRAIARRVLDEIPDDGVLLLDSGSMTLEVADQLPAGRSLVVVTNSLPAAALLAARPGFTVLALPGRVRSVTQGAVGDWTRRRIEGLHADVAVLGANGLDARGATTTLPEEVEAKRAMLGAARHRVLAVTASKIGSPSLCHVAGVGEFDAIITDSRIPPRATDELVAAGAELIIAEPPA